MTTPKDPGMLEELIRESRSSPRKRAGKLIIPWGTNFNDGRFTSVLVNCLQPGTYVQPHRHNNSSETLQLLGGRIAVVTFHENGDIRAVHYLTKDKESIIREGTFHTVIATDQDSIMLDVYKGTAKSFEDYKQFAPWAPAESDAGSLDYLVSLQRRIGGDLR